MSRASWSAAVTVLALALLLPAPSGAQQSPGDVLNAPTHPLLSPFRWRSIGPVGQGGRVDDIEVDPSDTRVFFVGFATGGLWKTTNNGTTFRPVFDTYETHSIGDIAIAPSRPEVVYVGTGEANNRQSSSFGAGMYKSTDGGETFSYVGLRETQTIARVLVHPSNPDVVWVAANGHLFGPNPERGVYKSTDGGATWRQVLEVNNNTGATDLVLDPSDPNTLFAATYQRRRTACCFVGGGPGSGLWRSDDGGETWERVRGGGFPEGTKGRIALAMTPADPDVLYAQIELAADDEDPLSEEEAEEMQRLSRADSLPPDPEFSGIWRSEDKGQTWEFRSNMNGRPMYFSQIRVSPQDPDLVYSVDLEVRKSRDGGRTFEQLDGYGHVDQHALWINPMSDDHMLIGNDGSVDVTWDEGETWESLRTWAVGQPYHASVDMRRPYYVCTGLQDNGSWCGPSSVRNGPILQQDWYRVGGGDGFYTQVDPTDYTMVYAESQGGNIRRINMRTGEQGSIRPQAPSTRSLETNIRPEPPITTEIRWNWNTPLLLSPHNPRTLYAGGNRLFISRDQGETWTMTEDLTKDIDRDRIEVLGQRNDLPRCNQDVRGEECIVSRNDGVSAYSTLTTIAESPIVPGLFWVGSDDGNIQVSRDGGATWTEVGRNVPGGTKQYYVSRVEASHFDPGTAYVSLDGHRSDDLSPYVFVTRDYGATWVSIAGDLPSFGNVNTVRQDPKNPTLLYVGTEFGFFASGDEGTSWVRFMPNLPVVRIDDVLVHPRDGDLVLATHGRSVWVMDDITPLQAMRPEMLSEAVHLFEPREAVLWANDVQKGRSVTGDKNWTGENAPEGTAIHYALREAATGAVTITISDPVTGEPFRTLEGTANRGMNRIRWDLRGEEPASEEGGGGGGGFGRNRAPMAAPGVYLVTLSVNGEDHHTTVKVLTDHWMGQR
ncbi:MAG: WD40/YVTN/BNR-like repeat-containing protein [Longimicrobiales bacterium]